MPDAIRLRYPGIEWRKIAGLRDVIAHEYFGIDNDILWDVIQNKVVPLQQEVRRIMQSENKVQQE